MFNFFMIYYSLILGLAVTETFSALGRVLHSKGVRDIGILIPLFIVVVLIETMANFIDAWDRLQNVEIDLLNMILSTLIGGTFVILASLAAPKNVEVNTDLGAYFLRMRGVLGGLLLAAGVLILATDFRYVLPCWDSGNYGGSSIWFLGNVFLFGSYIVLCLGRSWWSAVASMVGIVSFYPVFYIEDITGCFPSPTE